MFCHSDTATSWLPPLWQGILYQTADTSICMKTCANERDGQKWCCSGNVILNVAQQAEGTKNCDIRGQAGRNRVLTKHVQKQKKKSSKHLYYVIYISKTTHVCTAFKHEASCWPCGLFQYHLTPAFSNSFLLPYELIATVLSENLLRFLKKLASTSQAFLYETAFI